MKIELLKMIKIMKIKMNSTKYDRINIKIMTRRQSTERIKSLELKFRLFVITHTENHWYDSALCVITVINFYHLILMTDGKKKNAN